LFNKGIDKIAQKVGEEAVEVVIASKTSDDNELIYETADLLYHLIVLLTERGIELKDIKKELFNRFD
jgi:phosphoribosyl-ATP pyrophosphohydrolase